MLSFFFLFAGMSCLVGAEQQDDPQHVFTFNAWALEHDRTYPSEEAKAAAMATFKENEAIIATLNADEEDTAEYGHTQFSDMSAAEFQSQYLGVRSGAHAVHAATAPHPIANQPLGSAPPQFDWRDHGAVTPVKNQGGCGSW